MKKIGIIGCGKRCTDILTFMDALGDTIQISALYDPERSAMEDYREAYNPDAKMCADYLSLAQDPDIDWVFVMSPNLFHREHACAALEAGKNVFCEKPLATTPEDCQAIKQAQEKSGAQFVVGFTLRFSPHYRRIRQLIEEGRIGDIISMEFNETLPFNHGGYIHGSWRRFTKESGGHLLEKCSHDLDLANYMVGSFPAQVASFGGKNFFVPKNAGRVKEIGKNDKGKDAYFAHNIRVLDVNPFLGDGDVVDNQVVIIEYENGTRATFHTNCNSAIPERRMYILGTEGTIRSDVINGLIEVARIGFNESIHDASAGVAGMHGGGDDVLAMEISDCILHDALPCSTLDAGYDAAMAAFAIEQARETGTVVDVKKFLQRAEEAKLLNGKITK